MRIHSIEIENITSLKGKHQVNLRDGLQGEELFAITGPTGAGKSSLLSAISLALYGKTYKGALSSNDFVTTGMPQARVSLNFTLAGKEYYANWSIKVLKKNGEPIKNPKPQRELICENIALEQVSIADILGLDFDQFCKTIILNQGEFAKFLHSSFRERKDIIEKLYRTQELSYINKILKEKIKAEEAEYKLQCLSFEKALPYTEEEIQAITNDLKSKLKNLELHEDLTSLFNPSYDSLKLLYQKLVEEKDYLGKIQKSNKNLEAFIEKWNLLKSSLQKASNEYESINKKNQKEVPRLREAIGHVTNLEHILEKLKSHKQEHSQKTLKLELIVTEIQQRSTADKELSQESQQIKASFELKELFLKKTKNEIYVFKEDIQKLKNHLAEEARVKGQEEILISQITQQKTFKENLVSKMVSLESSLMNKPEDLEDTLIQLRRKREANLSLWTKFEAHCDKLGHIIEKREKLTELDGELSGEAQAINYQLNLLLEKQRGHLLIDAIEKCHEEALSSNECPVCHSTDLTKLIPPTGEIEFSLEELEKTKSEATKLTFKKEQVSEQLKGLETELNDLFVQIEKSKAILFTSYTKKLNWKTFSEVSQGQKILKELFNGNQKQELEQYDTLLRKKSEYEQAKKELAQVDLNYSALLANKEALTDSIKQINQLISTFLNNWKEIFGPKAAGKEVIEKFDKDIERFNQQVQVEQKYISNKETLAGLITQEKEITQRISILTSETKELEQNADNYKKKLSEICADKDPIALLEEYETIEKASLKNFQEQQQMYNKIEKQKGNEEQSLRIFKEQIVELQNLQKTYIVKLKNSFKELSKYDGAIPSSYPLYEQCHDIIRESLKWTEVVDSEVVEELLPILEARLESTWSQLIEQLKDVSLELKTSVHTNKKRIEEYNAKIESRKDLEKELEQSKKSIQLKNRLLEVFGKDEFRSYALGLLEEELVMGANQELNDLCDGRYQLKLLPGKGAQMEFFVSDSWRESTLRKISTLSGGETFLVSLAMALALAELTRGQSEIDSFFIDEGFGHLDVDSIDEVLEVLMNIQNRGKQIGIISHVKALTDRIPVNLTLQKSSMGESRTEFRYN